MTDKLREAAQQALEALDACVTDEGPEQHELTAAREALKNLRAALAQQKHKPLFAEMIAQHPGLAEELAQQDAQAVPTTRESAAKRGPRWDAFGRLYDSLCGRPITCREVAWRCYLAASHTSPTPPAQQDAQKKHKPLFAEMIAQHPGLAEELAQQDAQAVAEAIRAEPTEMIHKWRVLELIQAHAPTPPAQEKQS